MQSLERHRDSLKRDDGYGRFAYLTFEDLECLSGNPQRRRRSSKERSHHSQEEEAKPEAAVADSDDESEGSTMMLAVRAPPGSTLEVPAETGLQKEEVDELLGYLNKEYRMFINAGK